MLNGKKIIAVIPARSGSKGLKDKNIKTLLGRPLLSYTVEAARKSGVFDRIVLSTDSRRYAKIGMDCGAEVPFLRHRRTSGDGASSWGVVAETLSRLGENFDVVALLQPTSPLRSARSVRGALAEFFEKDADAVVSVCEFPHSKAWINTLPKSLSMRNFVEKKHANKPRQKLGPCYILNGAVYIVKTRFVKASLDLFSLKTYAYIMDREESVDIDCGFDFKMAEFILRNGRK